MPPGSYLIMLDEIPIVMGTVSLDQGLTLCPTSELSRRGIDFENAVDPLDGSAAAWISLEDAEQISEATWSPSDYIVRHLEAVIRARLSMFVGLQETVNRLTDTWSPAAREISANRALVERFMRMSKALLDERVPVTEIDLICANFLEQSASAASMDALLHSVRTLSQIQSKLPGNHAGSLLFEFDPEIETTLAEGLKAVGDEFMLALTPEFTQEVLAAVRHEVGALPPDAPMQVLIVRDRLLRRYVRRLVEIEFPSLFTLSQEELAEEVVGRDRTTITLE
jgi:type III secretion protein V